MRHHPPVDPRKFVGRRVEPVKVAIERDGRASPLGHYHGLDGVERAPVPVETSHDVKYLSPKVRLSRQIGHGIPIIGWTESPRVIHGAKATPIAKCAQAPSAPS